MAMEKGKLVYFMQDKLYNEEYCPTYIFPPRIQTAVFLCFDTEPHKAVVNINNELHTIMKINEEVFETPQEAIEYYIKNLKKQLYKQINNK